MTTYNVSISSSKRDAISVTWRTPTGQARSLNLGCTALALIEEQSGLPGGYSTGEMAFRLRVPLAMITAIQAALGIDVKRRKRAYSHAIASAIAQTRAMNFPVGDMALDALPVDFESMLLPEEARP